MIICAICGNVIPDTSTICLFCGALAVFSQPDIHTPTDYSLAALSTLIPDYEQKYHVSPQPGYPLHPDYSQPTHPLPMIPPPITPITPLTLVTPIVKPGALIAEILLNLLLGVFGVGWLMAGEAFIGLLLLTCGILIYWPVMIIGTLISFTLNAGPGIGTLLPLALGTITLNATLLHRTIKRKMGNVLHQALHITPSS